MSEPLCPAFSLPATSGLVFDLAQAPKPLIIYFYPKDNTPGCTNESMAFRDLYPTLRAIGAEVVGISRDSLKSHENFKAKFALPFELLSDSEETVCRLFNVIKTKKMYGKEVQGIERSTFIIGANGNIAHEWRGVKVVGHADDVLATIQSM